MGDSGFLNRYTLMLLDFFLSFVWAGGGKKNFFFCLEFFVIDFIGLGVTIVIITRE